MTTPPQGNDGRWTPPKKGWLERKLMGLPNPPASSGDSGGVPPRASAFSAAQPGVHGWWASLTPNGRLIATGTAILLGGALFGGIAVAASSGGGTSDPAEAPAKARTKVVTTDPQTAFGWGKIDGGMMGSSQTSSCPLWASSKYKNDPAAWNAYVQGCLSSGEH